MVAIKILKNKIGDKIKFEAIIDPLCKECSKYQLCCAIDSTDDDDGCLSNTSRESIMCEDIKKGMFEKKKSNRKV